MAAAPRRYHAACMEVVVLAGTAIAFLALVAAVPLAARDAARRVAERRVKR